jgi:hypothetical protein
MLEAGPIRLRPILMTTAATMMAAVPSALGLGAGAETRGPMAIAVLGGLTLSTLLSLLVVPCFYVVADRIEQRLRSKKARRPSCIPPKTPSFERPRFAGAASLQSVEIVDLCQRSRFALTVFPRLRLRTSVYMR